MKQLIIALAASAILMTSAMAQKIGVTLSAFEHQFLVNLRRAMEEKAKEMGVQIQFVEAQGDIGKQLNQIQTFISQGIDAIIVNPVDTTATPKMTKLVTEAKIPLVYVNLQPAEETLPKGVAGRGVARDHVGQAPRGGDGQTSKQQGQHRHNDGRACDPSCRSAY